MVEIIREADPRSLDEVQRNFRPMEVREFDATGIECIQLGLRPANAGGTYRVMVAYYVSKLDANKRGHLAKVLGGATGGSVTTIPCGGEVDWAWIQDMMLARVETIQRRAREREERLRLRQLALPNQLTDIVHEMEAQKVGRTTHGYGGFIQRSN